MAKDGIGSRVSVDLINQLEKRQEIVSKKGENSRKAYLLSANTPWVKLRSSVNRIDEDKLKQEGKTLDDVLNNKEDALNILRATTSLQAESFILAGGLTSTDNSIRSGINRNSNELSTKNAYSNFTGDYGLGYRPMPGITSVNIKSKGTFGTLSEANVNFKVHSVEELEICELLYFRPGYTALLEWGNSVYVDNDGNIKQTGVDIATIGDKLFFSKTGTGFETLTNEINIRRSSSDGNYDGLFGFITNFSFDLQKDGSYDCSVKIVSAGSILEGLKPTKTSDKTNEEDDDAEEENRKYKSIYHYIFHYLRVGKRSGQFEGKDHLKKYKQNKVAQYLDPFQVFSYETDIEGHYLGDQFNETFPLHYITLGSFLMMVNKLNSWRDPKKTPGKDDPDFILFDTSFGNKFSTFPDHISADPIVSLLPQRATGETGDLNGKAASTNIFQSIGLQDVRDAGEVYSRCNLKRISPLMEKYAKSTDGGVNDVLNIFVSTYAIEKSIDDLVTGTQDETVGMYNVIKDILSNVQGALGEVNSLDLFYNYTTQKYQAVDRNHSVPGSLPVINMSGLNSVVSNVSISSTISSAIASQVAIAAQGNSGNVKENLAAMMEWNRGAIDRHLPIRGTDDTENDEDRAKAQAKYLKKLYNFYYKWNDGFGNIDAVFTIQKYIAEDMESLRSEIYTDMQNLKKYYTVKSGGKVQGTVPVELSFDIDGIHGFLIGTTFKINKGLLPSKYDNWAYIITGIENKVSQSKWITSVKTQFYPDRNASSEARNNINRTKSENKPSQPRITREEEIVGDVLGTTPNADDLRTGLQLLGYSEKGRELSNGGDITPETAKMGRAVASKIKLLYPNIEVTFTGGNDQFHQRLNYNSRHKRGTGLDFVISPSTPRDVKNIEKILKGYAAGNYPNFRYINEYDNPTRAASGKHFHISWGPGTEAQANVNTAVAESRKGLISKYII